MESTYLVLIALAVGFATYLAFIAGWNIYFEYISKQLVVDRLRNYSRQLDAAAEVEKVNNWQIPINNWLKSKKSGQKFSNTISLARLNSSPLAVASNLFLVMAAAFLFGIFFLGSILPAIILSVGIYFIVTVWLRQKKIKYEQRFVEQLPQALSLMANALSSSASLVQAIEHVVRESDPPIKNELLRVIENLGVGMNLDQALEELHKQMPVTELEIAISAIMIQRRVGGNLAKLLARTSEILKEKITLKGELMVETAQARMSGKVIGLMPIIVIGFLMLIDRSFITPLFTHPTGLALLGFAAIAEIAGFLLIRRILDIEF